MRKIRLLAAAVLATVGLASATLAKADATAYARFGPGTTNEAYAVYYAYVQYGGQLPCQNHLRVIWYGLGLGNAAFIASGNPAGPSCTQGYLIVNYSYDAVTWGQFCTGVSTMWGDLIRGYHVQQTSTTPWCVGNSPGDGRL